MNLAETRKLSADELKQELHELYKEQFNLKVQKATGQMTQTHLVTKVRKNIARVNTLLNEKVGESK